MRIISVDDHEIVRMGLKFFLNKHFKNIIFGEASGYPSLQELLKNSSWDLIILDINLPVKNGLEILKELKTAGLKIPVLIYSRYTEEEYALRALKAGASGYVSKGSPLSEVELAIQKIISGEKYINPEAAVKLANGLLDEDEKISHKDLSDREYYVFKKLACGYTVSEIAEELSLSIKTVSTFRSRVLIKMKLKNNLQIIRYAITNNLDL